MKAFVDLLEVLEQNPSSAWQERLGVMDIAPDSGGAADDGILPDGDVNDDALATLRL